jgi:hypothetical protein
MTVTSVIMGILALICAVPIALWCITGQLFHPLIRLDSLVLALPMILPGLFLLNFSNRSIYFGINFKKNSY